MKTKEKRPTEKLLITLSYVNRIAAATSIASSAWSVPDDLEIEDGSEGITGTHYTWAIVSDGEAGNTYYVTNTAVTAQGERIVVVVPIFVKSEADAAIA